MNAAILEATSRVHPSTTSTVRRWAGRVVTAAAAAFLTFDTAVKLAGATVAIDATTELGYARHHVFAIGLIELACLVVYLVPRTATIGAVLWTGYLGGAIASNLRLDLPLASHVLFPLYVATLLWGGLYLRDPQVRAFVRSPV